MGGWCKLYPVLFWIFLNLFNFAKPLNLSASFFQNACKVHTRTHTDSMPYTCSVCPKVFRERGSLERHVRTHTGEKPYQCTYCGRSFAEHGTLSRHLKAKGSCCKGSFTIINIFESVQRVLLLMTPSPKRTLKC